MELREFAERVLFATSLPDKLAGAENLTDEHPGLPLAAPTAPGRPAELRFKEQGASHSAFPGTHRLDNESERGRLLHFFANHELLATELMALVLLRFPNAPAAFRKGVLQTLKEEQAHTRLYLARMSECGVHFGELPVSGYFWRAVSPMENPIDYVAGLSLTFEQANLDFACDFAKRFAQFGDAATARLLEKIYRDEIAHVAYGLKWFRRWKNPNETDWAAFCRQLKYPLSPQRAKGPVLNVEGRRAAGLDPHFIAELDVFSQSKGRTPSVFVFNPFAEGWIAQGKSFSPKKHQTQLARDLANLPQFLCRGDDVVLLESRPSVEFLSSIKQAGFVLPEFVELKDGRIAPANPLLRRKLGQLRPWAWGPDSIKLLAPLFRNAVAESPSLEQPFNANIAKLYSKAWSAALLRKFLKRTESECSPENSDQKTTIRASHPSPGTLLCTTNEVGVPVSQLDEALAAIQSIRQRGHHKIVVKETLGLAGHNSIRLWEPELLDTQRRWMMNLFRAGRELVIEPWLEREVDFSVQLEMSAHGLKVCGYTGLINDRKGQYQANWVAPNFAKRIPAAVLNALGTDPHIPGLLEKIYRDLFELLEIALNEVGYTGPVGIDSFVYRTPQGDRKLKPIVEINPRYTMGRVLVELMRQACPGSHGELRLINHAMVQASGFSDFVEFAAALRRASPLRLEGQPVSRIREGTVCLNDPVAAQACLAIFQISRTETMQQRAVRIEI